MSITMGVVRTGVVAALAATALAGPQAVAADAPRVALAKNADAQTKAFVKAFPRAAMASGTACGADYKLTTAIPLPKGTDPKMRLATLFTYTKGGNQVGCAILDNNMGSKSYKLKVQACDSWGKNCQTDEGNFLNYAGPVRTTDPVCGVLTATMWSSAGYELFNYKTQSGWLCD
ncbi:hypothetical protein [Streptomyces sp. NPDC093225]|uniref:hypothetical protein n=1 Tax=Streptomyces sp. NPDC093225 TaxID=3366034 RepID=UPI003801C737